MSDLHTGCYVHDLRDSLYTGPAVLVRKAIEAGFDYLMVKIADGAVEYNPALTPALIEECHAQGLEVWGWQYVYHKNPTGEGKLAASLVSRYNLAGFAIDAELEAKQAGAAKARAYMGALMAGWPSTTLLGLSSYRWPSVHPELSWDVYIRGGVDLAMPQVYWQNAHNPAAQLARCLTEYAQRWPGLPVVPTGAAYQEAGWRPEKGEVTAFAKACQDQGLEDWNWWEWHSMQRYDLWDTVVATNLPAYTPAEPVTPASDLHLAVAVETLNVRSAPDRTKANVIDQVTRGDLVTLTGRIAGADAWAEVQLPDGTVGWCAVKIGNSQYLIEGD